MNRYNAHGGQGLFLPLLLLLMSVYPPLSTDMYLPALPQIAREFGTGDATMNLSLVLFFICFAVSTLFWGPVSDKYGRRRAAMAGVSLYTLGSLACALSQDAGMLIGSRMVQAFGAGAPVTVAIAIVQDVYAGEERKRILSLLSALMLVAPVTAPVLGSVVLSCASWRMVFWMLAGLGVISLLGLLRFTETHADLRSEESVVRAILGVFRVASNRTFTILLVVFSMLALYALGFVGGSSLIYMQEFQVSPRMFSLLFATNAVFAILGPLCYVPLSRRFSQRALVLTALSVVAASGVMITVFGQAGPLVFCLLVIPGTIASSLMRPLGVGMMLQMGGTQTGAVSALINFMFTLFGSIGMEIVSLNWQSRAHAYGIMALVMAVLCLAGWLYVAPDCRHPAPEGGA